MDCHFQLHGRTLDEKECTYCCVCAYEEEMVVVRMCISRDIPGYPGFSENSGYPRISQDTVVSDVYD